MYTPEPGLIVTFDTTGGEFPIETDDDVLVTTTPSESVALATHSKVTPGVAKDGDSCQVLPVLVEPSRQTKHKRHSNFHHSNHWQSPYKSTGC